MRNAGGSPMIKAENVTFEYDRLDEEGNIESKLTAVDHLIFPNIAGYLNITFLRGFPF